MIKRIDQTLTIKKNIYSLKDTPQAANQENPVQTPVKPAPADPKLLQKYYVSFGQRAEPDQELPLNKEARDLLERSGKIAKKHGHSVVSETHFEKAALESFKEFLVDLDSGARVFDPKSLTDVVYFFINETTPRVVKEKSWRKRIIPVIEKEIEELDAKLATMTKTKNNRVGIMLSKNLMEGINDVFTSVCIQAGTDIVPVTPSMFLDAILNKTQVLSKNPFALFMLRFSETVMLDARLPEEKIPLSPYADNAKNILKNLSLGTHMFVTYDNKTNPMYLIDSIEHVINKGEGSSVSSGKSKPTLTVFNDNTMEDFFLHKVRQLAQDKAEHIVVLNFDEMLANSATIVEGVDGKTQTKSGVGAGFIDIVRNNPKNIKFVIIGNKDSYDSNLSGSPALARAFENFGEASIPVLSPEQAKKVFREQPSLIKKIEVPFSRTAIDRVIEACALLDGTYPEKAQKVMKKLAAFYVGKKEITEVDVKRYMEQAKDLFRVAGESDSLEVVFNTGKKLKDLVGKDATKKEAEAIVSQIRSGKLGTKGAIIYSQDGSVGSGRKFTAKAIAGEAKAPYMEINSLDFGTEKMDLLGKDILSPENSIKKLFSILRTQAEASPNKSAVLFVENFEYFSVGEFISEYHQKAMAQLLREMENANQKGLNILVVGSVSNPDFIGDSTIKSSKFIDKIEVESPARNINARETILSEFVKKRKLKLGVNEAESKALLQLMAETTEQFPFVYLTNLVDKIKTVALERKHKVVDKTDIVEAYLQLTTGRPSSSPISEHRKRIVASHECGHAFTLEYMHRLAEKFGLPWHLGERVNFITLDPRSIFGGAMYGKQGKNGNEEYSMEKVFTDLICDFGGHSAEKRIYNIDGSWGITSDMAMATSQTETAIGYMGLGHNFGKTSLWGSNLEMSDALKQVMENDRATWLHNAMVVSDLITKTAEDFYIEFTDKYAARGGTGECLIHGDDFRTSVDAWFAKQSTAQKAEFAALDQLILSAIEATKKGQKFGLNKGSILPTAKTLVSSGIRVLTETAGTAGNKVKSQLTLDTATALASNLFKVMQKAARHIR